MGQQQLLQMSHLVPQQGYLVLRDKSERAVRSQKDEPFTQNKAHYITKPGGGEWSKVRPLYFAVLQCFERRPAPQRENAPEPCVIRLSRIKSYTVHDETLR